jgi:hypothetical protein
MRTYLEITTKHGEFTTSEIHEVFRSKENAPWYEVRVNEAGTPQLCFFVESGNEIVRPFGSMSWKLLLNPSQPTRNLLSNEHKENREVA